MEYTEAVAKVSTAINAQTSTIAAKGDYGREAVEEAEANARGVVKDTTRMSDEDLEKEFDYAGNEMNALLDRNGNRRVAIPARYATALLGGARTTAPVPACGPRRR